MSIERRFISTELRAVINGDKRSLEGYASKFNTKSSDLGNFVERVNPGAFTRSIRNGDDVKMTVNHDPNLILGRVKNKSLSLEEDGTGLKFRCELPDTQLARDTHELAKKGYLDSMSFAFIPKGQSWENETDDDGNTVASRTLHDVDLQDVSIVLNPAYPGTEVTARMFDQESLVEVRSAVKKLADERAKTDKGHGSFNFGKNADSAADHLNAAKKHMTKSNELHQTGQYGPANAHSLAAAAHYEAASKFTPETPEGDKDATAKACELSSRCEGSMRSQAEIDAEERDKDAKGHGSEKKGGSAEDHEAKAIEHFGKAQKFAKEGNKKAAKAHAGAGSAHLNASEHIKAVGEGTSDPSSAAIASEQAWNATGRAEGAERSFEPKDELRGSENQAPKLDAVDMPNPFDPQAKEDWWNAFDDAYSDLVKKGGRGYGIKQAVSKAIATANLAFPVKTETPDEAGGGGKSPTAVPHTVVNTTVQADPRSLRYAEGTYEDRIADINKALCEKYGYTSPGGWCRYYVVETYDDHVIVGDSGTMPAGPSNYYSVPYSYDVKADAGKQVVLGEMTPVEQTYQPTERMLKIAVSQRSAQACDCRCAGCAAGRCKDCTNEPRCSASTRGENMDPRSKGCACDCAECKAGSCAACSVPGCDCGDEARKKKGSKANDQGVDDGEVDIEVDDSGDDATDDDSDDEDDDDNEDRGAKTKKKAGKNLHAGDFAWVGDAGDPSTWKLPIHDEAHAKNALARFNQTQGIPADKKEGVWKKIVAACKKFGVQVSEENSLRAAMPHSLVAQVLKESDDAAIIEALRARTRLIQIELEA